MRRPEGIIIEDEAEKLYLHHDAKQTKLNCLVDKRS